MSDSQFDDRRIHPRYSMDGGLELSVKDQKVRCQLNDISISAVSVIIDRPPKVGETVAIDVPGLGVHQARVTRVSDRVVALDLVKETQVQLREFEVLAQALG